MSDGFPIGAVVAFSSSTKPDPNYWHLCDGSAQSTQGPFQQLFNIFGNAYGSQLPFTFNLPDYRGFFLRGTNHGAGVDPDTPGRVAQSSGGVTGDEVGTVQQYATSSPNEPFVCTFSGIPTESRTVALSPGGYELAGWNKGFGEGAIDAGSDDETRPLNLAVNYYIKYADNPN